MFVVPPLLHKYESNPLGAVNVVEVPQAVISLPRSMVGLFTSTVTLSVQLTPLVVVVQVYVVVTVGETLMLDVVAPPGDHACVALLFPVTFMLKEAPPAPSSEIIKAM